MTTEQKSLPARATRAPAPSRARFALLAIAAAALAHAPLPGPAQRSLIPGPGASGEVTAAGAGVVDAVRAWLLPAASAREGAETRYTCPMHPHYIAEEPGACPICGMDLVAVATQASATAADTGGTERAAVVVPPETIQSMGVRTARAEPAVFGRRVRAFGQVQPNMRRQSVVSSRVAGWVEELAVTAEGDTVQRGQTLYRIFSPELVGAQEDYFAAVGTGIPARIKAAARRLRTFGLSPEDVDAIARRGRARERFPVAAPGDGVVSRLAVRVGSYVKPGDTLLEIQDYSSVWLEVSVPEKDLPLIDTSTTATVSFPKAPIEPVETAVDYVYPTVDLKSRTGRVRLVLDNASGRLRPGAYADVELFVEPVRRLSVPSEAVLRSRDGYHVVLARGGGRFQPRAVTLGLVDGARSEVLAGLAEGDLVVVSGQFLLDSESALRESFRKLERVQAPLALIPLSDDELAMLEHLIDAALYVHEALIDGYDVEPRVLQAARDIYAPLSRRVRGTRLEPLLAAADEAVAGLQAATTESALRAGLGDLTRILRPWIIEGRPERYRERELTLLEDAESGEAWLQIGGRALNPRGPRAASTVIWPPASPEETAPPATGAPSGDGAAPSATAIRVPVTG